MEIIDNVVKKISPLSKIIAIIALYAATAFAFIAEAADIGGGFFPVIGGLLTLIFVVAVFGGIPTLLVLKKDKPAVYALIPVTSYWFISTLGDCLSRSGNIYKGAGGLTITIGVFSLIIAMAFFAVATLGVLYYLKKGKKLLQIAVCILIGSLLFFFLIWVLLIALYAEYNAAWTSYFYDFYQYLFLPIGFVFAFLNCIYGKLYGDAKPDVENIAQLSIDSDASYSENDFENQQAGNEDADVNDLQPVEEPVVNETLDGATEEGWN